WAPCWRSFRTAAHPREAALALADPARRSARAGAARLRVPHEPARYSLAAPPEARAPIRAHYARRRAARTGGASGEGRRPEFLGVVVLSRLLRGGAGPRKELARLS